MHDEPLKTHQQNLKLHHFKSIHIFSCLAQNAYHMINPHFSDISVFESMAESENAGAPSVIDQKLKTSETAGKEGDMKTKRKK